MIAQSRNTARSLARLGSLHFLVDFLVCSLVSVRARFFPSLISFLSFFILFFFMNNVATGGYARSSRRTPVRAWDGAGSVTINLDHGITLSFAFHGGVPCPLDRPIRFSPRYCQLPELCRFAPLSRLCRPGKLSAISVSILGIHGTYLFFKLPLDKFSNVIAETRVRLLTRWLIRILESL